MLALALVAIALISTVGLLWKPTSSAGTAASALEEYDATRAELVLAPGWTWPEGTALFPAVDADGSGMRYGPGAGRGRALGVWFCSWASAAADSSDPALQRMGWVRLIGGRRTLVDRPDLAALVGGAIHGDRESLRVYVEANCESAG